MFKVIGGAVVYGFALFGVYNMLEDKVTAQPVTPDSDDTN